MSQRLLPRLMASRVRDSRKSVLLLGPRQVGKSTLCRDLLPDLTIELTDEREYLSFSKDVDRLKREVVALPKKRALIVVDEIQRVPALLNTVQALLDKPGFEHRFVLTGSSAKRLRSRGNNLLPGRVILERLDPLSFLEVPDFDLDRALQLGMLPGIYLGGAEAKDLLETYVEVYLREEIRAEALVQNIGSYARFLDVAAIVSGQWINYSKIACDTEIPKETIRRYFALLEDTLLAIRLPPFRPKQKISRRVSQRDRIFLFDIGVRNALLGLHRMPSSPDQIGQRFEQWFTLQVIILNHALRAGWHVSSYRTEADAEVDLVIERDTDIVGIEIKASRNVGRTDLRGLSSLAETVGSYKPFRAWIVYLGQRSQRFDKGVTAHPYATALRELTAR